MGDKTKWIFDDDEEEGDFDLPSTHAPETTPEMGDESPTRVFEQSSEKTELFVRGQGREEAKVELGEIDPVVGWLVVIKGPGIGRALNLGIGVNAIGRAKDERVALPFGDKLISQHDHAKIIYDDEGRSFLIAHGSGKNVTRMNGTIVASPIPLEDGAVIQLTKATHLRFRAFCDQSFDWADVLVEDDGSK